MIEFVLKKIDTSTKFTKISKQRPYEPQLIEIL